MDRLRDKVAIVTGGSAGIGRATARLLAAEGACVAIGDIEEAGGRQVVSEIEQAGGQALFVRTDVASAEQTERLVNQTLERWGRLHILHNNAYENVSGRTVVTMAEDEWDRVMAVCLKGMYLMSKFAIPAMLQAGGGSIINMASAVAILGNWRSPAYVAAKGAIVALTKSIAIDFGRQGVRANCIAPAMIGTEATAVRRQDPVYEASEVGRLLLARRGWPEDVAAAVLFLASDESSYMTGGMMVVDGGASSTPNWGMRPQPDA